MTVISISTIDSAEQVVSGIPRFITVSTSLPSIIFYTLDGKTPTTNSTIYTGPIQLPTNQLKVVLKIYATDGVDSSQVVCFEYETDTLGQGARTSHSGTNAAPDSTQGLQNPYPFGNNPIVPGQIFLGAAAAGFTTDNPLLPQTQTGFNADGYPDGYVNVPLIGVPTINQPIIYSGTDVEGQTGLGIGNLPKSTVQKPKSPPETTNYNSNCYDPRALVIYQDFTGPQDPTLPVEINKQFYESSDVSHYNQGALYFNSIDTPSTAGSFVKQQFDPVHQTLTYYYYNSRDNKWIISKTAYSPKPNPLGYGNIVFGRQSDKVFQWILWKPNYLY